MIFYKSVTTGTIIRGDAHFDPFLQVPSDLLEDDPMLILCEFIEPILNCGSADWSLNCVLFCTFHQTLRGTAVFRRQGERSRPPKVSSSLQGHKGDAWKGWS
jgi:hypothetical protein